MPSADGPGRRQNYANHAHRPIGWQIAFILATVATGLLISAAIDEWSLPAAAVAGLGVSVLVLLVVQRRATLNLQNRIIRMEMQARLTRLGRAADMARLSPRQLIALRFAADAEMPALIDRAIAEQLTGDQIKRAVTDWQPDLFRT
jgi:hypothetical protein